jgi:aminoglycoside phosphotransferase (APT) family kinase protein
LDGEPSSPRNIVDVEEFARDLANFLRALYRVDAAEGPPAGEHNFFRGGRLATYDQEVRGAIAALADGVDATAATAVWRDAFASEWKLPASGYTAMSLQAICWCATVDWLQSSISAPAE